MFASKIPVDFSTISQNKDSNSLTSEPEWLNNPWDGQLLLDVFADEKNLYVKSAIAGVKPSDLEISINNDMLTIRGVRQAEEISGQKDYFCQECYWGGFSRSIILPTEVKSDKISATLKDGILLITLPKSKAKRNVTVKVKKN